MHNLLNIQKKYPLLFDQAFYLRNNPNASNNDQQADVEITALLQEQSNILLALKTTNPSDLPPFIPFLLGPDRDADDADSLKEGRGECDGDGEGIDESWARVREVGEMLESAEREGDECLFWQACQAAYKLSDESNILPNSSSSSKLLTTSLHLSCLYLILYGHLHSSGQRVPHVQFETPTPAATGSGEGLWVNNALGKWFLKRAFEIVGVVVDEVEGRWAGGCEDKIGEEVKLGLLKFGNEALRGKVSMLYH